MYLTPDEMLEWDQWEADRIAGNVAYDEQRREENARAERLAMPGLVERIQELEMQRHVLEVLLGVAWELVEFREFERDQAYRTIEALREFFPKVPKKDRDALRV